MRRFRVSTRGQCRVSQALTSEWTLKREVLTPIKTPGAAAAAAAAIESQDAPPHLRRCAAAEYENRNGDLALFYLSR